MAYNKKYKKKSRGYPVQDDVPFYVEILDDNRVEVRSGDRDDYIILPMSKGLTTKLTKKDNDIIGNIYKVVAEDILLETDMGVKGIISADKIIGKVAKKNFVKRVKRVYTPKGVHNEYSDYQKTKGNFNIKDI